VSLRTLSDHISDIAQNCVTAGATRVTLSIHQDEDWFSFDLEDNGKGIPQETLGKIFDPFYTTRDHKIRRVGLGLPFIKEAAHATGGKVEIQSEEGVGTRFHALFGISHIDCQPLGDLAQTLFTLITSSDNVSWNIQRSFGPESYEIHTDQLFSGIPASDALSNPSFLHLLLESLRELESSLLEGGKDAGEKKGTTP